MAPHDLWDTNRVHSLEFQTGYEDLLRLIGFHEDFEELEYPQAMEVVQEETGEYLSDEFEYEDFPDSDTDTDSDMDEDGDWGDDLHLLPSMDEVSNSVS